MYGLITRLSVVPGRRDEMIAILKEGATGMPGCLAYVVAKDISDGGGLWVTEVWDNSASHDASLSLPSVRKAMNRAQGIITNFDDVATTTPTWGVGLPNP
jgi:quinol monooxygenase YgiN